MIYNDNNIFAKILRQEIKCNKVFENEVMLAFYDVNPRVKIHVLAIPKKSYTTSHSFHQTASELEIIGYYQGISEVVKRLHLLEGGYRLISNCGKNAGQEVFHYHTHILGGEPLGKMVHISQ